jgi:hypothetical protein
MSAITSLWINPQPLWINLKKKSHWAVGLSAKVPLGCNALTCESPTTDLSESHESHRSPIP